MPPLSVCRIIWISPASSEISVGVPPDSLTALSGSVSSDSSTPSVNRNAMRFPCNVFSVMGCLLDPEIRVCYITCRDGHF